MTPEQVAAAIAAATAAVLLLIPFLRWSIGRNITRMDSDIAAVKADVLQVKNDRDRYEMETLRAIAELRERVALAERGQQEAVNRFDRFETRVERIEAKIDRLLEHKRSDR